MEGVKKIKIVILAAGKGKRMNSDLPKALTPVKGKSMIKRLLESVAKSGLDERPVIVVGYGKEKVMEELGNGYNYVVQEKQLGTGHALASTHELLKDKTENVLVLPSDQPSITPETIQKLVKTHLESGTKITMATVKLPDFMDWREFFYQSFSRIVRDANGKIVKDVQFKDMNEEEKKITEVNPIYFCFKAEWLWQKIKTLNTNNAQKEYYMTDLIKIAIDEGKEIELVEIDPKEALAANSKEELEILEKFVV